ncbi:hypothetical protein F5884DRAFT_755401 [Xylogone sp. PMI_703]|nr:hypothetical protein F5884DRAFT_755401 [Xylogone sp. PMI_703]
MILDPIEEFKKTTLLPAPTSTASPTPLPTIVPTPPIFEKITSEGTRTLWVGFAVILISTLIFIVMAWRTPVQKRLFHVLVSFMGVIATISYFAMATGDGVTYIHSRHVEHHKHTGGVTKEHIFRQVFWAHYVQWALTTPLLILNLAFLAGLSGASIIVAIFSNISMVLLGLFSASAHRSAPKWGYFAMAIVAYLFIIYQFILPARRAVLARDNTTTKIYASLGVFVFILWTLYPILWALGDGAGKWDVDTGVIAYAVLDILAVPVFGFWLLAQHARRDVAAVDGFWSNGLSGEGTIRIGDDA